MGNMQQLVKDLYRLRRVWDFMKWVKGSLATDVYAHPVSPHASMARGCCLLGGIEYTVPRNVYLNRYSDVFDSLRDTLTERGVLSPLYVWNDEQESVGAIYELIDSTIARLEGSSHG